MLIILATLSIFGSACSSSEVTQINSNSSTNRSANTANTDNKTNEITIKDANSGENVMIPGINEPNSNSNAKPLASNQAEKVAAPEGRPAPDDSVFTTQLTDVGLETRTFKSHPLLKKVERITSPKGKTIKVYLRSGKIVELPGDKLANLSSVPASEILREVGIVPKEQPSLPSKHQVQ